MLLLWLLAISHFSCAEAVELLRYAYETGDVTELAGDLNETRLDQALGADYRSEEGDWPLIRDLSETPWLSEHETGWSSSYRDLILLYRYLQPRPGEIYVDLGSGYGRALGTGALLFPGVLFVGYEVHPRRVRASVDWWILRRGLTNVDFVQQNFGQPGVEFPEAQVFISYDSLRENNSRRVLHHILRSRSLARLAILSGTGEAEVLMQREDDFEQIFRRWPLYVYQPVRSGR